MLAKAKLKADAADQPALAKLQQLSDELKPDTYQVDFDIITTRAAFDALEEDWNALFKRAGNSTQAFQGFAFLWHWANHYLDGQTARTLSILTARRQGELIMVWPLVREKAKGIVQLYCMGEPVTQYGDVLIDDVPDAEAIITTAISYLNQHSGADLLRLRRVRDDAHIKPALDAVNAPSADHRIAPYLDLKSAPDWQSYEQRYSPRGRRNRKRLARRLDERGEMEFELHTGGKRARELCLEGLDLKIDWLNQRGLMSQAFASPQMRGFFADVAEGRLKDAECFVAALSSGGQLAALEMSFKCHNRALLHVLVYNLKYEKSGAGVLLLEQQFRKAYDRGITTYDLLAPGDSYKIAWSDDHVAVADHAVPMTLRGQAFTTLYLNLLRTRLKSAISIMPKPVRQLLSIVATSRTKSDSAE